MNDPMSAAPIRGEVSSFDDPAGYGTLRVIAGAETGREYFFHCTAIADGSRQIDVGATVEFTVEAGRLGRWEAANIAPATG